MSSGRHVMFAVFGSAGDVFPSIAVARSLAADGHRVSFLAPPSAALYCRSVGLPVVTIGTGEELAVINDEQIFTTRFDGFSSWRRTCTTYLDPILRNGFVRARSSVAQFAPDLVVVHPLATFGSLIAADLEIPWAGLHLYPQLSPIRRRQRPVRFGGSYASTVRRLEQLGGHHRTDNPLLSWGWAPSLNVSVHDPALVAATDLDRRVIGTPLGFPYWDALPVRAEDADVVDRLHDAVSVSRPIAVATFGSFIGQAGGRVWREIADATAAARMVTVLVGVPAAQRAEFDGKPDVLCTGFVPMSHLAPLAAILIHHGGIGTTYAGLRHGVPAAVIPQAFDQTFNGRLLEQVGVGERVRAGSSISDVIRRMSGADVRSSAVALAELLVAPDAAAGAIGTRLLDAIAVDAGAVPAPRNGSVVDLARRST